MSLFTNAVLENKNTEDQSDEKMNRRADLYKVGNTIDDVKEANLNVELNRRKNNLESEIERRRKQKHTCVPISYGQSLFEVMTIDKETYDLGCKISVSIQDLDGIIQKLSSPNAGDQYLALVGIRKLLALPHNAPIQQIIDRGLVFNLVGSLDSVYPEFVFEACTSLTSICSGNSDQANVVLQKGGAQKFIQLCDMKYFEIQEQAILGIGNLASDGVSIRDRLIQMGALDKIKFYLHTSERVSLIKNCLFALTNFFKGVPAPQYEISAPVSKI